MKIAFVTDDLSGNSNGIYASAYRYAKALRSLGHTVKKVGYGAQGEDAFPLPMRNIPLVTRIASSCGFTFAEADEHVFEEALKDVDLIHLFLPFDLEIQALEWAREHQIPVTAAFHLQPQNMTYNAGFGPAPALSDAIYSYFKHRLYNHVSHVQCPSQMIKNQLEEQGYASSLHVISNGVPEKFKPNADASFSDGKFHIITVGRYAPEKNQKTILDAVAKSAHKDDIVLHVCGKGNLEEDLKQQAQALEIACEFSFLEEDDLLALEQKCPLYIHASIVDIEAMSVIEGFAAGAVPIIGKAPLSAPSAFALCDESLFEAEDSDALAKRIDWWMEHPEERKKWAEAYQKEAKSLSVTNCVKKFLAMAQDAIAQDQEAYAKEEIVLPEVSNASLFSRRKA